MSVTDIIGDQLTVIRNAVRANKKSAVIKKSKVLEKIIDIIKKEGFIENYKVIEDSVPAMIKVYLKYTDDGLPVMEHLERVSTPGRRNYVAVSKIRSVIGGAGIAIYSTNKGILTDREAKQNGVGGELICRIW